MLGRMLRLGGKSTTKKHQCLLVLVLWQSTMLAVQSGNGVSVQLSIILRVRFCCGINRGERCFICLEPFQTIWHHIPQTPVRSTTAGRDGKIGRRGQCFRQWFSNHRLDRITFDCGEPRLKVPQRGRINCGLVLQQTEKVCGGYGGDML